MHGMQKMFLPISGHIHVEGTKMWRDSLHGRQGDFDEVLEVFVCVLQVRFQGREMGYRQRS